MRTINTKGNAWIWGILLVALLALAAFLFYTAEDGQTPENGTGNGVDTSDWETYTNDEFGFSIMHPSDWEVGEFPDDLITPKFNIYPEGTDTEGLPFTHHSEDVTHVSIFPEGIPTEGFFGESATSTVDFQIAVAQERDYMLGDGTRFATYANAATPPESWGEPGFIFSHVRVDNLQVECFSEGEPVSQEQCDPLMGDTIVRNGDIDQNIRDIQVAMMESFEFTNGDGNGGGGNGNGDNAASYKDLIRVTSPLPDSEVSSPLTIEGEARGNWFFEATFPIVLTDWDGEIIAEGFAEAQDEWMTTDYVPFEATLTFDADTSVSNRGSLILQKQNASGLPENADAFEYTIFFEEE